MYYPMQTCLFFTCMLRRCVASMLLYPNLSEGVDSGAWQMHGDKEFPFNGVTKWWQSVEEGAKKPGLECVYDVLHNPSSDQSAMSCNLPSEEATVAAKLEALVYDILLLEECAGKRCSECGCHTPGIAFWHLTPNSARTGYATGGALFISAQLSTDAVSALRKVSVLRLWKRHSVRPGYNNK